MKLGLPILVLLAAASPGEAPAPPTVVLSILGTADLHGHVLPENGRGGLAVFGGYVANLRRVRARDGGAVVLVDAGDAFQGTLESNLNEGAAVVRAMNQLGYAAMAIGNHEFDYGPAGPSMTPRVAGDDPRGALLARAKEARFPFLAANIADASSGRVVSWPHVAPSAVVEAAGVKVGIVGVTTDETLTTTMAENVRGLRMIPVADAIRSEAAALRAAGCSIVVAAAHAGAACKDLDHADDVASCDDGEILDVARKLPTGLVDVIVAGHTHAGVAHRVNGIAIVESFAYGRAFGRVDLAVDRATGHVASVAIEPPHDVRGGAAYAGAVVVPDDAVAATLADDVEKARRLRERPLGVRIETRVARSYAEESALGNLFADLMRSARGADVALTNGGGLRADLEPGPLTYGRLYEAYPFDNRFATVRLTGADLRRILAVNLGGSRGILSVSGVRATARCAGGRLDVALVRADGRPIADGETLTLATSDFIASGGDPAVSPLGESARAAVVEDAVIREALAAQLEARGGVLRGEELLDPEHRRLDFPGSLPVRCR